MGKIVGLIVEEKPQFVCPECGRVYASQANLDKHIEDKHPENKTPTEEGTEGHGRG